MECGACGYEMATDVQPEADLWTIHGAVYDVRDFPRQDLLRLFPDATVVINHVVIFESRPRFFDFLARARKSDDINFIFLTARSKRDVIAALGEFENTRPESFAEQIATCLAEVLDAHIERLDA